MRARIRCTGLDHCARRVDHLTHVTDPQDGRTFPMDGVIGALLDSTVGYKIPKTVRIRDRTLAAYACVTTICIVLYIGNKFSKVLYFACQMY